MNRSDKVTDRRGKKIFWFLIGSMFVITFGTLSYALSNDKGMPGMGSFSVGAFFRSLEAKKAIAASELMQRSIGSSLASASPLLPGVPEYENTGLEFGEILPDEDSMENWNLSSLPALPHPSRGFEPLAVCDRSHAASLADFGAQDFEYGNIIAGLLMEDGAGAEDDDEVPWIEHTVANGERMIDISHKYGILVATISKANGISDPNRLTAGRTLLIPRREELLDDVLEEQKSRAEAAAEAKRKAELVRFKEYTVKPGDSLWSIASANKLSIDSLYGTNIMRNPDRLSPGTVLRIPNQDGICVKVAKGQTVATLSKKYSVSESAIRMANGLPDGAALKVGQEIFLPGASQSITAYRSSSGGGGVSKRAPSVARAPSGAAGTFSWPASGRITSPFGWRKHPIRRRRIFHSGMDIAAPRGTPIRAARGGQVIFSGWMSGYGRVVILRHDSTYTTMYAHCQTLRVKKGANVQKGAIIATVGSSGQATGPHVHFEVRQHDRPVNPRSYLK